jgi:hypothetical protein
MVRLHFPAEGVEPPVIQRLGDDTTLEAFLARVRAGRTALAGWPWRNVPEAPESAVAWLAAHTRAAIALHAEATLVQCVDEEPDGTVVARYLFDSAYARAHPEALDPEHLGILHGTVAAKMFDDGLVVLDHQGLAASLRWRSVWAKGVRLTRTGQRGSP